MTLQILQEISILDLLNAWYNFTSGTQKPLWNSVRRIKKLLAYSRKRQKKKKKKPFKLYVWTEPCQCQHRFWTFQTKIKFRSFLEKYCRLPQIQKKNSCWVVGARTNEGFHSLKFGSYPIFYEIVVNQSDRPGSRKDLHKITKKLSINGLFWWNFICTSKMMNRVYIPLYFRHNNNLLHFNQGINR